MTLTKPERSRSFFSRILGCERMPAPRKLANKFLVITFKTMNDQNYTKEGMTVEPVGASFSGRPQTNPTQAETWPDDAMIILPLRNSVLFPLVLAPLSFRRKMSVSALEEAVRREKPIGVVCQRDAATNEPLPIDLYSVGTSAQILRVGKLSNGLHQVYAQGVRRFKIIDYIQTEPFLVARVEFLDDGRPESQHFEAQVLHLRQQMQRALELMPTPAPEISAVVEGLKDPAGFIDFVASWLDISLEEKQELLETIDLNARVTKVALKLRRQVEILELTKKIGTEAKDSMDRSQREYMLREQLKAIRKELGESEQKANEFDELKKKITDAKMSEQAEQEALKSLARLERMAEGAPEYSMVRSHLDWLLDLPWNVTTEENIDLAKARHVLDADHHDLAKVKKRLIEFLAVRKLNPQGKSPILCFVGPPGVGKTSLGQSIATAMNRKFVRQSLGGVHDEAEIRGHRRTYIGALPGRIIQGLKRAGSKNPVFMLDEIDKLSASFQGDPSAALLEVLDPEQNNSFQDHYIDAPFDLSQVLFVATANVLDAVPAPLRDRMEVIELLGYAEEDKTIIARRYLVPRQLKAVGLAPEQCSITDEALAEVVRGYTREAGVRQLEREIGAICRGVATGFAEGSTGSTTVDVQSVRKYLGAAKYFNEVALRTSMPGVATGLAWTAVGGDILFVEATKMSGDGKLLLTGQLGDVMKESAQAALSLVKSRSESLGIDDNLFKRLDLHVHLPAGAIPKDGPSAGVTLFTALVSLLTGRCVRNDVAMTGEISLRGLVLPVGGIKEKVLAAKRAGIQTILLPALNRKDLEELPTGVREAMHFELLESVDDVLEHGLEARPDQNMLAPAVREGNQAAPLGWQH
jgi:ATP-dependent Lon protease